MTFQWWLCLARMVAKSRAHIIWVKLLTFNLPLFWILTEECSLLAFKKITKSTTVRATVWGFSITKSEGSSDVRLSGGTDMKKLNCVWHVSNITHNLMSRVQLCDGGHTVLFDDEQYLIEKDDIFVGVEQRPKNLYTVNLSKVGGANSSYTAQRRRDAEFMACKTGTLGSLHYNTNVTKRFRWRSILGGRCKKRNFYPVPYKDIDCLFHEIAHLLGRSP